MAGSSNYKKSNVAIGTKMGLEAAKDCIPLVNAQFGGRERRLEFEAFKIKVKKNRKCFDLSYIFRQFTLASLWKSNWSETRTKKKRKMLSWKYWSKVLRIGLELKPWI